MNSIIQVQCTDLDSSLKFYKSLNFKVVLESQDSAVVSDGKSFIELNNDKSSRSGVKFYRKDWNSIVSDLKKDTKVIKIDNGFLLGAPSGIWIYLMEQESPIAQEVAEKSTSVLGAFAGMSMEVIDIEKSIRIWDLLGFKQNAGNIEQGWISLMNEDNLGLSLMSPNNCPHMFFNPSLTYFNGENNLSIIKQIRDLNIPIAEEITRFNKEGIVDNIILKDPGGLGFFIYSD